MVPPRHTHTHTHTHTRACENSCHLKVYVCFPVDFLGDAAALGLLVAFHNEKKEEDEYMET